jgi:hypothetical protein
MRALDQTYTGHCAISEADGSSATSKGSISGWDGNDTRMTPAARSSSGTICTMRGSSRIVRILCERSSMMHHLRSY